MLLLLFSLFSLSLSYCYCKTGQGDYCSGGSGISCPFQGRGCRRDDDCTAGAQAAMQRAREARAREARERQEAAEAARVLAEAQGIMAQCSSKPCINAAGRCVHGETKRYVKTFCCETDILTHASGTRCPE